MIYNEVIHLYGGVSAGHGDNAGLFGEEVVAAVTTRTEEFEGTTFSQLGEGVLDV